METQSLENIFARSWQLLTRNWIIIVPGIIVGVIIGAASGLLTPPVTYGDPTTTAGTVSHGLARLVSSLIVAVIGIAGFIITQCYTVGMAGAAWARGTTTLADGASALNADAGNVFVAAIGLFVLGVVAALLAIPTLALSILVFYLFLLYTIPSAVVGNHRGFAAIGESIRIVRARFVPTLIIGVLLAVIQFLGGWIALVFAFAPLLGPIISAVISQIVVAFASLVVVGEYLNLRGTPADPADPADELLIVVFALRIAAIVVGIALFAFAELRDAQNERKPYATGSQRLGTFYDDLTVFSLRIAGVGLVSIALVTWVIGNHQLPH